MDSNTIQKYSKLTTAKLKAKAQTVFNKWIRQRDQGKPCISCGSWNTSQASHFYSAGKHTNLRFTPDNCHLSCLQCNFFLHGNLLPYRESLIKKIGLARVETLDQLSKIRITKQDRFLYIDVIETYSR